MSFGDYIKIDGSPTPGLTLQQTLRGHSDVISRIAWSPDGCYLASPSKDNTIRIWDIKTGECIHILKKHSELITSVTWSPDSKTLASASYDKSIRLWEVSSGSCTGELRNHSDKIFAVAWSPNGKYLASASIDKTILLWNATTGNLLKPLDGHIEGVTNLAWSPNSKQIASSSWDQKIRLWDVSNGKCSQILEGHTKAVFSMSWSSDGRRFSSSSEDKTIRLWNTTNGEILLVLEVHSDVVNCAIFSPNGRWLVSSGLDANIFIWNCNSWSEVANLKESVGNSVFPSIAFHPRLPLLATLGEKSTIIRIWEIDEGVLTNQAKRGINYTTAKLILIGDSGVGKTGLGWRLAHGVFKEHASTHGQQFWTISELRHERQDGTNCEAVLWDLAGQHVYRQIHSIFFENIALALVLFDPTNRLDPLKGVLFWLEQLKGKGKLPPTLLVGARVDRGGSVLSESELDQFCQRYGVTGGYISTSAMKGDGLEQLLNSIKKQIRWDDMTSTVTTVTFKRIKDFVLSLKENTQHDDEQHFQENFEFFDLEQLDGDPHFHESFEFFDLEQLDGDPHLPKNSNLLEEKPQRDNVLVSPNRLREMLEQTQTYWQFSDKEMITAIEHLDTHGLVTILRNADGNISILLKPDLLVNLAASIMLLADKNIHELGAINETQLLQGQFNFEELESLEKIEQNSLLDAAVLRFLEHNICFRETSGDDTLLIFPSLIKQKRPLQDDFPSVDDISYIVRGRVENLYASLVVLLGYTPTFTRINHWQNQAQYEIQEGEICGFRMLEEREGEIELVLYYAEVMPQVGRNKFQELFEKFLYQRDVKVTRIPQVLCKNQHPIERSAIVKRVRELRDYVCCDECGEKTSLRQFDQPQTIGISSSPWLQREASMAILRSAYEAGLSRIKSYRRNMSSPRAYLSYFQEQNKIAENLIQDLRDAGVVILDKPEDIKENDFVIVLDTSGYRKAYQSNSSDLGNAPQIIKKRLESEDKNMISLSCEGKFSRHNIEQCTLGNFSDETHNTVTLFNLLMELYAIPITHKGFEPLRQSLHEQWERISHSTLEVFISYAWGEENEEVVNQLDSEFLRRGVDIIRDKRDLGFKGDIKGFMEQIGLGKAVLLIISEKYLKSPNCCFELMQIAKCGQFKDRIFPIVLSDAKIYDPIGRIKYVKYWENKKSELDDLMKQVSSANLDGFREDIDLYTEIRILLPKLMDILKDMNTLTPDIHRQEEFSEIFCAVMRKIEE